jgi:hypothetical protein
VSGFSRTVVAATCCDATRERRGQVCSFRPSYVYWIRRYIVFHGKAHPSAMGAPEISAFLSWLAVRQHVSTFRERARRSVCR